MNYTKNTQLFQPQLTAWCEKMKDIYASLYIKININ